MRKKLIYGILIGFVLVVIAVNGIAYNHAYKFTHYVHNGETRLKIYDTSKVGITTKLKYMMNGIDVPRPENLEKPEYSYSTERIHTTLGEIEVWETNDSNALGTVIMFHGYAAKKSTLITRSNEFKNLNYNVILVDFLGSGGSDGNEVNIGYNEANQVKICYEYAKNNGEDNIYLFGISMGSVAIMKCINDYQIQPKGIILECPFGDMKPTIKNRCKNFGIPTYPFTDLLMVWGSYHAGFNTYKHNPAEYAKNIHCPVLLMHGINDHAVTEKEINTIYTNLPERKTLKQFENTGHKIYTDKNSIEWIGSVNDFIQNTSIQHP